MRTAGLRPFVDVSAKQSQASDRVMKIKHALQVLGDTEGPEVDGLRAALKRAESDEGDAHPHASEGVRVIFAKGSIGSSTRNAPRWEPVSAMPRRDWSH